MLTNQYVIEANARNRDLWVILAVPNAYGRPQPLLPDGRNLHNLVAAGDTTSLPAPPNLITQNNGAPGDMLWTTSNQKIISQQFLDVLQAANATGYSTYPITIHTPKGQPITGYHGFTTPGTPNEDFHNYHPHHHTHRSITNQRIITALTEHGVTRFSYRSLAEVRSQNEASF